MMQTGQFLSKTHTKHVKRCAKITAFKRTYLKSHTTSQSVFFLQFCDHIVIFKAILSVLQPKRGKHPQNSEKNCFDPKFKTAQTSQFLSKSNTKHVKRCAKIAIFQRTLLERRMISQSVFFFNFVSIWAIFGLFSQFYCQNVVKHPPKKFLTQLSK